jgi:hypothetical protein
MPLTSVLADKAMFVIELVAKVAVSDDALGTVAGLQLPGVFQSPVWGVVFHVALPA